MVDFSHAIVWALAVQGCVSLIITSWECCPCLYDPRWLTATITPFQPVGKAKGRGKAHPYYFNVQSGSGTYISSSFTGQNLVTWLYWAEKCSYYSGWPENRVSINTEEGETVRGGGILMASATLWCVRGQMYERPWPFVYSKCKCTEKRGLFRLGSGFGPCGGEVQWMGNQKIRVPMLSIGPLSLIQLRQCKSCREDKKIVEEKFGQRKQCW